MRKLLFPVVLGAAVLSACGSDKSDKSDNAAKSSASSAYCTDAKALGSISKASAEAMAMDPAGSAKDFTALADKVSALKMHAPSSLQTPISTVAARLKLEAESHEMMEAAGGNAEEERMLEAHKDADEAALATLVAATKTRCDVNLA